MVTKIQQLATKISTALKQQGLRLATAESCTGGGLSYFLTEIAGSSDWFERGFVTYSNTSKIEMLGVSAETLSRYGEVSQETAEEMAKGALRNSEADISVSVTGIAGPGGGSLEKPVGTVWTAWAYGEKVESELHLFTGNRHKIRQQTIQAVLIRLADHCVS